MDKNIQKNNVYISEEEKTLNWEEIQNSFKKTFGNEIYNSWLQKISLVKEFNDYLILGVPTRFFRDWIVSRYLDKILEQVKSFKLSLTRIEFKFSADFIQVPETKFGLRLVSPRSIKYANTVGILLHVWTINDEEKMRSLIELGVDGLMTDECKKLKAVLEKSI